MGILENNRHGADLPDSIPSDSPESSRESKRSFLSDIRNFSKRLFGVGERRISGRLDEEVPENLFSTNSSIMTKTKYDVDESMLDQYLPRNENTSREEKFSSSVFEWVKTERAGDICKFKEFILENGIEYAVFQDNTRVNASLIGDVVLMHDNEHYVLGGVQSALEKTSTVAPASIAPSSATSRRLEMKPEKISPVLSILEKSKKKKTKINFEFIAELPSSEVLGIIRDNFEGSDDELYEYFISRIDKKKFVNSIINSIQNK
jgi:hypothetical protein